MKFSTCLLLLISTSAVAGDYLRKQNTRKLRKDSDESSDRSCSDEISLEFFHEGKCFDKDGSNDVNLCHDDADEAYEALQDGSDWCEGSFEAADDEDTDTFKLTWDNDSKKFEPSEDDSGSGEDDISHEAEKKLKKWEYYYEYEPSGNSRDRKLSADCTGKISLKFYEDEKCMEEDSSNDDELCGGDVAEEFYEELKEGGDWCKDSFDAADDEGIVTFKLIWNDEDDCFDSEHAGHDANKKLEKWEGYCDYDPSGNSRE